MQTQCVRNEARGGGFRGGPVVAELCCQGFTAYGGYNEGLSLMGTLDL